MYRIVELESLKQNRVSYSSYGTEIWEWNFAEERGYNIKMALLPITDGRARVPYILNIY